MRRALAAVIVCALAGCGEDEGSRRAVVAAAEKTGREGPTAIVQEARVPTGTREEVVLRYDGEIDSASGTARFRISTDLVAEDAPGALARKLDAFDGEIAVDASRTYVQLPALTDRLGADGRWVSFRTDDPAAERAGLAFPDGLGRLDITRPVDHVRAADDVEREDALDEETSYRMAIDYSRYLELADPALAAELKPQIEETEREYGTTRFPATAWVDDEGRIARFETRAETVTGTFRGSYRLQLYFGAAKPELPTDVVPLRKLRRR